MITNAFAHTCRTGRRFAGRRPVANMIAALLASALALFFLFHSSARAQAPGVQETEAASTSAAGIASAYLIARQAANQADYARAAEEYSRILEQDRNNLTILRQAANLAAGAGKMDRALPLARRIAALDAEDTAAIILLAVEAFREGHYDRAAGRLGKVRAGGRGTLLLRFLHAWALAGQGRIEEAETLLDGLPKREAFQRTGRYHKGLMRTMAGDGFGALRILSEDIASPGQTNPETLEAIAVVLSRSANRDMFRALLETAREHMPEDRTLSEMLARIEQSDKALAPVVSNAREGAALALFDLTRQILADGVGFLPVYYLRLALHLDPRLDKATLLLARALDVQARGAQALSLFDTIPHDSPLRREALVAKAEALENMDDIMGAIAVLQSALRTFPEALTVHVALGDLYRRHERCEEAAASYDRAIELSDAHGPDAPSEDLWRLYFVRGVCHSERDRWPLAEADFLKSLELRPHEPYVLNYLGYSWVEMGLHLERAQELIADAARQRPGDGAIVDSMGWVLYRLADYEGAVAHLQRAVELSPVDPTINDHFGDALWKVGRRKEAEFQWRRALSFIDADAKETPRIARKLEVGLDRVLREEAETEAVRKEDREESPAGEGDAGSVRRQR